MSRAKNLANLIGGASAGTSGMALPSGTTAQRPATPTNGMMRYNSTTGFAEVYTTIGGWANFSAAPPVISTVAPTTYNGESGTQFTITGANFSPDATVSFITSSGSEYAAASISLSSSSVLLATTPQDFTVANEPLDVKVVQASGTFTKLDVIDCGGLPSWTTAAGNLGIIYDSMRAITSLQVSATDPDNNATISYSVVSGALPTGMTLNSSTGAITGTANAVASDTTYNFTIRATDNAGNSDSDRAFSCIVKAPIVQSFIYTGSDQTWTKPSGLTSLTAYIWGAAGGGANGEGYSDAGGAGGYASGTINVTSIATLVVQVGGGGGQGSTSRPARAYPNGGLMALRTSYTSGGGGGRSALFNSSVSAANAVLIAGGGGGAGSHGYGSTAAGYNYQGGNGGGTSGTGGMGYSSPNTEIVALAGTQSAGGSNTSASSNHPLGRNAAQLTGADAGDGQLWSTGFNAAGGGGDGWYGGGVKDDEHGGGGGGSGYYNPSFVTNQTLSATAITGGKKTTINPPQTASTYYSTGVGVGNANASGGNGRIVLVY